MMMLKLASCDRVLWKVIARYETNWHYCLAP